MPSATISVPIKRACSMNVHLGIKTRWRSLSFFYFLLIRCIHFHTNLHLNILNVGISTVTCVIHYDTSKHKVSNKRFYNNTITFNFTKKYFLCYKKYQTSRPKQKKTILKNCDPSPKEK